MLKSPDQFLTDLSLKASGLDIHVSGLRLETVQDALRSDGY